MQKLLLALRFGKGRFSYRTKPSRISLPSVPSRHHSSSLPRLGFTAGPRLQRLAEVKIEPPRPRLAAPKIQLVSRPIQQETIGLSLVFGKGLLAIFGPPTDLGHPQWLAPPPSAKPIPTDGFMLME